MQRRLFSLLSQPPVKFVNRVLGEEINCVCLGWRAQQQEGLLPLSASTAAVQSPHAPFSTQEPRKCSRSGINSLPSPGLSECVKIYQHH